MYNIFKSEKRQIANSENRQFPSYSLHQTKQPIHKLHQTIGNQLVQRLHQQGTRERIIQAKLKVGESGDQYEMQADRVAKQVINLPETEQIGEKINFYNNAKLPTKKQSAPSSIVTFSVAKGITQSRSGGRNLSPSELSFFEPRFGSDFSHVRIHSNTDSENTARLLNARAFTHKNHIVFAAGEYSPNTKSGKNLMAHELTHVIQQQHYNHHRLVQRDERPSSGDESSSNTTQSPPTGLSFEPLDLFIYPLIVDIWNDIANQNVGNLTLSEMRLQGAESAALWNASMAIMFAGMSIPPEASFTDFLSSWLEHGDELQELTGGGSLLLDYFSAFAGVSIESYLGTDLFLGRLQQHSLSVLSIYALIQGISSVVAATSETDVEEGQFSASQIEQQTAVVRGLLGLVLKEQFKAPDFFNVSPIRLSSHPAYAHQQQTGGDTPQGLILEHSEGVGEGQGGDRLRLGLTLNIPQLLGGDSNNLQEYRDWQGSLWFNYNQINPTEMQQDMGALSESDFRVGSIFGGGGFLGVLESGARFSSNSDEARELTAWFLHGGFGYSGDSNSILRRLGFTATYTDWTELDIFSPEILESVPTAGSAGRIMPFTQLQFNINERHQFGVGAALGFVTGSHENFGLSDFTGNLSYIYQGDRAQGQLPEFRVDLSASVNRLDWWNPDSPLVTGLQARVGVDRFFVAGQLNLGASNIPEERLDQLNRFSSDLEADSFRIRVPTGVLFSAGVLLGSGSNED